MKCISSPALDDTQIARYIEGEGDEAVVAHIQECAFCRERAYEWTFLQNRLKKQVYRVNCPTSMELGDYHLGYLPNSERLIVAQHVRECMVCRGEIEILEDFLTKLGPETSSLSTAKVLIATLIGAPLENNFEPVFPALRGDIKGPLTFAADGIVIVLDVQPTSNGRANLLGQVAADDQEQWTEAVVELRQNNQLQFSTKVDDLGGFQCEGIVPGTKVLQIISKDNSIIIVSNFEVSI